MTLQESQWTLIAGYISVAIASVHMIPTIALLLFCDFQNLTTLNFVYVTYFYNADRCGDEHFSEILPPKYNVSHYSVNIDMPEFARLRRFTMILLQVYNILDFGIILSGLTLIYNSYLYKTGTIPGNFYLPWITFGIGTCGLDICSSIYFLRHYFSIQTLDDWLNIVGAEYSFEPFKVSEDFLATLRSASYDMYLYSCKFFVGFAISLFLLVKICFMVVKNF